MSRRYRLLLVSFFLFVSIPSVVVARMVSIAGGEVNLRAQPSLNSEVRWILGKGFPLQVIKSSGKWLKVRDFENDIGWIYSSLTASTPHMIVKKKIVNIRSGPGKKFKVTGQASYGVVFRTLKSTKSWVKVQHESGRTGWIARPLLWGW